MIVYRFEKNGIGPYVGGVRMTIGSFYRKDGKTRTQKIWSRRFSENLQKAEDEATLARMDLWQKCHESKQWMFGCRSKDQLRAYFGGNFKYLFKEGYRIKRYRVPDEEVVDLIVEVAFPVRYHKLQTVQNVKKASGFY